MTPHEYQNIESASSELGSEECVTHSSEPSSLLAEIHVGASELTS